MKMWRYTLPMALFILLVWFFVRGLTLDPSYVPSPLIGKQAPAFNLPELMEPGRTVSEQDLRGRFTLLNVWATWCVGCYQEHPFLIELSKTSSIPIYGFNWKDNHDDAVQWLRKLGNPYTAVAVDNVGDSAIDWGVYGAPETFLIDPNGIVVYKHLSPLTREIWERDFVPRISAGVE